MTKDYNGITVELDEQRGTLTVPCRRTGRGADTHVDTLLPVAREQVSKTGSHWVEVVSGVKVGDKIRVVNFTNSGKDESFVVPITA